MWEMNDESLIGNVKKMICVFIRAWTHCWICRKEKLWIAHNERPS